MICDMVWHDMIWYDMWYDNIILSYDMIRYNIILCDIIWYVMLYNMIWYEQIINDKYYSML